MRSCRRRMSALVDEDGTAAEDEDEDDDVSTVAVLLSHLGHLHPLLSISLKWI